MVRTLRHWHEQSGERADRCRGGRRAAHRLLLRAWVNPPPQCWLRVSSLSPAFAATPFPYHHHQDVWLLTLAHAAVLLALLLTARTPRRAGAGLGGGAPESGNIGTADLACRIATTCSELLLLGKAVAVAILAPDALWPARQAAPGAVGLVCMFGSIATGFVGGGAAALMARQQLLGWEHDAAAVAAATPKAAAAAGADEEAGLSLTAPLLGKRSGAGEGEGAAAAASATAGVKKTRGTVAQLLRMSFPDTPVLLAAFAAGAVAALMAALVPYYTGRERWVGRLAAGLVGWLVSVAYSLTNVTNVTHTSPASPSHRRLRVHRPQPPQVQRHNLEAAAGGRTGRAVHRGAGRPVQRVHDATQRAVEARPVLQLAAAGDRFLRRHEDWWV
jgi:hypothetical protein